MQGTDLGQGESVIAEISVRSSVISTGHRTEFALTNRRIEGTTPSNTVFGIPYGKKRITQPLRNVSHVETNAGLKMGRVLIGLLLLVGGVTTFGGGTSAAAGVILLGYAVLRLLTSYVVTFAISDASGSTQHTSVSWLDRSGIDEFAQQINATLANHREAPETRTGTAASDVDVDVMEGLERRERLNALRRDGVLSEDEFEVQKRRLLDD